VPEVPVPELEEPEFEEPEVDEPDVLARVFEIAVTASQFCCRFDDHWDEPPSDELPLAELPVPDVPMLEPAEP